MPKMEITDVAENLVLMRVTDSSFNQGNVVCIALDEGLVFVDTGQTKARTAKFRSQMEKRFGKSAQFTLLTHTHWDHILGMDAFADVPIITTQQGVASMKKQLEEDLSAEGRKKVIEQSKGFLAERGVEPSEEQNEWFSSLMETKVSVPDIGVKDTISFGTMDRSYHYHLVGGHSECSATVFCESERILITGDNLVVEHAANSPCMLAGFNEAAIDILKSFEQMDVEKYIPGHGPIVENDYLAKSREWFTEMFASLKKLKLKEMKPEDAIADPTLPAFFEEAVPRQWENILTHWYNNV
ncbi:MAG: MBL fold metallo-hydrolase [Promethearchaeota archaeon]